MILKQKVDHIKIFINKFQRNLHVPLFWFTTKQDKLHLQRKCHSFNYKLLRIM